MTYSNQNRVDILQDRFALKTVSYLSASVSDLPHDMAERLRAARAQAVAKRKITKLQTASSIVKSGGSAAISWGSSDGLGWWGRIGSVMPLIALVIGMWTIHTVQNDNRAQEIAEVDAAILIDELPPAAFSDPGFLQFLKTNR